MRANSFSCVYLDFLFCEMLKSFARSSYWVEILSVVTGSILKIYSGCESFIRNMYCRYSLSPVLPFYSCNNIFGRP